jgi:uncharacterized protein with PIN domain
LDLLLHRAKIEVVLFMAEQADVARQTWMKVGKSRHKVSLSLGDGCSYALLQISGEPLLFKGGDFALTHVQNATESVAFLYAVEAVAVNPHGKCLFFGPHDRSLA